MNYPLNNKTPNISDFSDYEKPQLTEFEELVMRAKMQDIMASDEERMSPDTFGCDCLFLEFFVTEAMRNDFSLIAKDFLEHEYPKLKDIPMLEYVDTSPEEQYPDKLFENFVLNAMMNAVKAGSAYARDLFVYLHKTYYRKEYQQLKRFQKISGSEVAAIAAQKTGTDPIDVARVLSMAKLYGIEIESSCNFIYLFLADYRNRDYRDFDWEFMDAVGDLYKDCLEEVSSLFKDKDEMFDLYEKTARFTCNALRAEGFVEDFVALCDESTESMSQNLARTLAILKKTYKNREFTKEELMLHLTLYEALSALMCSVEAMRDRMGEVFYGERATDYYEYCPPQFHAEDVRKGMTQDPVKAKQTGTEPRILKKGGSEAAKYDEAVLLAEIEELQSKVHQQEGEIRHLRSELAGKRKQTEELQTLREQMENDRQELVALREHVYGLTEADDGTKSISLEEMKQFLTSLRIVIIGGHSNWVTKMRQEFPDWTYVNPTVSGALDATIVDKADHVYFFTDILSHNTYYRYVNVVREHKVSFGYLHGVNIENNVRKMYRDLRKETQDRFEQ